MNGFVYEIIIIDDGSIDDSWSEINRITKKDNLTRAIRFSRNFGKSQALHAGFDLSKGEVIITLDADLQDNPDEIPNLYNRIIREKIVAIFVLVGSINLPIIKFSVDWWNTLHQPATISKLSKPSIDPSMMMPLIIMTFAFIMVGLAIAILRIKTEIISRKSNLN